jgi:hypothetical protein
MKNDHYLVAWAAGLYDGEGSASMFMPQRRKTARRQMQVSQGGSVDSPPEVLLRFRDVVGFGNITGPYRNYLVSELPLLLEDDPQRRDRRSRDAAVAIPELGDRTQHLGRTPAIECRRTSGNAAAIS